MKDVLLPRGYLSYSAMRLYETDYRRFVERYYEGDSSAGFSSGATEFGSLFAEHLEKRKKSGDPVFDTLLATVPRYAKREHEAHAVIQSTKGAIRLLAKLDTYDHKTHAFLDYKTGHIMWTPAKVQSAEQMKFYTAVLYLTHKTYQQDKSIVWLETESNDGIRFTGHMEQFPFTMTLSEILRYTQRISKTALAISDDYKSYIKQLV